MYKLKLLFNKIESLILLLCLFLIVTIFMLQGFVKTNNLEAISYKAKNQNLLNTYMKKGVIKLKLQNNKEYEEVEVLVNGEVAGNFKDKQITIEVYNNDIIEINSTEYNKNLKVKILKTSDNIKLPKINSIYNIKGTLDILSRVIIK
ncbi:MAG: hypothetical protein FH753_14500 [Firmicutes bacterium]|nr:hypothetical protein [Bacillota bacterium]